LTALGHRITGTETPDPEVTAAIAEGQTSLAGQYRIGAEDVLDISVWKEDALKKEVLVRPDGGISFPLAGDLRAAGSTTEEVRAQLTTRLEKYIPDPVVSVSILKAANYKVYVIGRVNKPGDITAGRPIDVLQALAIAGGVTPFASDSRIHVMRKTEGRELSIPFNYAHVQKGEDLEQNIILKSGDVVVVP
jgi:polysaccharide export outer membrane protein